MIDLIDYVESQYNFLTKLPRWYARRKTKAILNKVERILYSDKAKHIGYDDIKRLWLFYTDTIDITRTRGGYINSNSRLSLRYDNERLCVSLLIYPHDYATYIFRFYFNEKISITEKFRTSHTTQGYRSGQDYVDSVYIHDMKFVNIINKEVSVYIEYFLNTIGKRYEED